MRCSNCGGNVNDRALVCPYCNVQVNGSEYNDTVMEEYDDYNAGEYTDVSIQFEGEDIPGIYGHNMEETDNNDTAAAQEGAEYLDAEYNRNSYQKPSFTDFVTGHWKQIAIISAAIIVICVASAISFVLIKDQVNYKQYQEYISAGEKYLEQLGYEEAVINYERAIELDPKNPRAYLKLARMHMDLGDYEKASEVLQKGYRLTQDKQLSDLLEEVEALLLGEEDVVIVDSADIQELIEASENVTLIDEMFNIMSDYTYKDYGRKYIQEKSSFVSKNEGFIFEFKDFPGYCYYVNLDTKNRIINEKTGKPKDDAKPTSIELLDMKSIFQDYKGVLTKDCLETLIGGEVNASYDSTLKINVINFNYSNCNVTIESDENGNLVKMRPYNKIVPSYAEKIEKSDDETGEDTDILLDKLRIWLVNEETQTAIANASLVIRKSSSASGEIVEQAVTDQDGFYETEVEGGTYTVEVSCQGYEPASFQVSVKNNGKNQNSLEMTPVQESGEIKIVLEWGSTPANLDAHLYAVKGRNQVHVLPFSSYYQAYDGGDLWAEIDKDVTNGYGPETVTIYMNTDEAYLFSVHNATGGYSSTSMALAESGAVVKVYLPGQTQPKTFTVPDQPGTWWKVFFMENGVITPVDVINSESWCNSKDYRRR